ncbi:ABC efflux pump, inner membrane subunit [Candidatus Koribacter versatilis Ellin345]|uniref:ABC efflux pump, inner membrane subunit n=1 Tax=Koribacter versatilis (strain Ellin345) TaxID=204669 RepID=Q1IIL6_KORVE|nr:ABC transporter permease [Candidatus Koribacter versatilis]ABF43284.1 ABC efflux pump, inner membrane subunit [Candidatus Koribacter versatilis Ellin345]
MFLNDMLFRLRALFRRNAGDRELDDELRFHLERQTAKYVKSGMSEAEAARRARLEFGGLDQVKEECHEARGISFIETLLQDTRYAIRTLLRAPAFTACAVLTLALGIGANTAIFSVVNSVLLNPLGYPDPQELLAARQNEALANLADMQRQTHAFSSSGGVNINPMDFTGQGEPVRIHAAFVDAGLFPTLGVQPMLGRWISPDEDVKGGPRNAVVSYAFWRDFLGSDPHVLGKTIGLGGSSYAVIGVMPKDFTLPKELADVFLSLWVAYPEAAPERGVHFLHTYWRLKPGVTIQQAQAEITQADHRLAEAFPDTEKERGTVLVPLHESLVGDVRPALLVLFGAVGLVLLIACANFAMLLMARAVSRQRELMIRASLGARNSRLIRQRLTESTLLALVGGAAGLVVAKLGATVLLAMKPAALRHFGAIHMDARVFLFVFAVSLLTGLVFGLMPAWSSSRGDISEALRENARTATASRSPLRSFLVTAELALALILLAGAGLLIKGFLRLRSVDPGFNPSNVMTMYLQLPGTRYPKIPSQNVFRRELLARINAFPGVEAAMITDLPLAGNYVAHRVVVNGQPAPALGAEPMVQVLSVMGNYFGVMQTPLRAGRDFTPTDREGQPRVAIVNQAFVRQLLPGQDPIGTRINWARADDPNDWFTIVGVVGDVKHDGLNQPVDPAMYSPFSQNDEAWRKWMTLVIRTRVPAAALVEDVKKQVWSLDSQIPVSSIQSMDDLLAVSVAQERFNMLLLGMFAALAVALAGVGIYGMVAYRVNQRTHEIGVYIALGAQHRDVLRLVMKDGVKLALIGIGCGLAGAAALTRLMVSLLFEVKPTDPVTLIGVALLLAAVAMLACYIPARRALGIHPMTALRHE